MSKQYSHDMSEQKSEPMVMLKQSPIVFPAKFRKDDIRLQDWVKEVEEANGINCSSNEESQEAGDLTEGLISSSKHRLENNTSPVAKRVRLTTRNDDDAISSTEEDGASYQDMFFRDDTTRSLLDGVVAAFVVTIPAHILRSDRKTPNGFQNNKSENVMYLSQRIGIWHLLTASVSPDQRLAAIQIIPANSSKRIIAGYAFWLWVKDDNFNAMETLATYLCDNTERDKLRKQTCQEYKRTGYQNKTHPFLTIEGKEGLVRMLDITMKSTQAATHLQQNWKQPFIRESILDPLIFMQPRYSYLGLQNFDMSLINAHNFMHPFHPNKANKFMVSTKHCIWFHMLPQTILDSLPLFLNILLPQSYFETISRNTDHLLKDLETQLNIHSQVTEQYLNSALTAEETEALEKEQQFRMPASEFIKVYGDKQLQGLFDMTTDDIHRWFTHEYNKLIMIINHLRRTVRDIDENVLLQMSWDKSLDVWKRGQDRLRLGCDVSGNCPTVVKDAFKYILKYQDENRGTLYMTATKLTLNLSSVADEVVFDHDYFKVWAGTSTEFDFCMINYRAALSASDKHPTKPHVVNYGTAGTGKTWIQTKMLPHILFKGAFIEVTYQSNKWNAGGGSEYTKRVLIMEEIAPSRLGVDPSNRVGGKTSNEEALTKYTMSAGKMVCSVLEQDLKTNRRVMRLIKTECSMVWLVGTNAHPWTHTQAIGDRVIYCTFIKQYREGKTPMDMNLITSNPNHKFNKEKVAARHKLFNALVVIINQCISCGGLPEISTDLTSYIAQQVSEILTVQGIPKAHLNRSLERIQAIARTLVMSRAIAWLCEHPKSPMRGRYDPVTGRFEGEPFSMEILFQLKGWLHDADICIPTIAIGLLMPQQLNTQIRFHVIHGLCQVAWPLIDWNEINQKRNDFISQPGDLLPIDANDSQRQQFQQKVLARRKEMTEHFNARMQMLREKLDQFTFQTHYYLIPFGKDDIDPRMPTYRKWRLLEEKIREKTIELARGQIFALLEQHFSEEINILNPQGKRVKIKLMFWTAKGLAIYKNIVLCNKPNIVRYALIETIEQLGIKPMQIITGTTSRKTYNLNVFSVCSPMHHKLNIAHLKQSHGVTLSDDVKQRLQTKAGLMDKMILLQESDSSTLVHDSLLEGKQDTSTSWLQTDIVDVYFEKAMRQLDIPIKVRETYGLFPQAQADSFRILLDKQNRQRHLKTQKKHVSADDRIHKEKHNTLHGFYS